MAETGKGKKDHSSNIKYCNIYGFTLCQQNGQRTYGGPPANWGSRPPPSRDCEVFIGRLPRMCFEDELIPLFLTAGELYEFRLMLDFSGTNRGYGYAHYATPAGAAKAIEKLNKYEIRPGHQIGVLKSKNNCRLLFGNISPTLNRDAFNDFIRTVTDQVLNVLMFKSFQQLKTTNFSISSEMEEAFLGRVPLNNRNNQFAIVEYENHKAAAVARRVLIPKYGHILAIDWAVPPRERKRFAIGNEARVPAIDRPLPNLIPKDTNIISPTKTISKVRPVPVLIVQPSPLDNASFMPKAFHTVVKYFKYLLSVCLYKSVDQLEIPLFICKEIERKIVDRITNLENCSQAVQLIFNYFSWYNEKKRFIISSDVQKLMEEVKAYSDVFIQFVNRRLKFGPSPNSSEDHYYTNVLPIHLNVLFQIILRSDSAHQAKLSAGIAKSLNWLKTMIEKGDPKTIDFLQEVFRLVESEDAVALDKASALAKSVFLNAVTSHSHSQTFSDNALADRQGRNNMLTNNLSNAMNHSSVVPLKWYENFERSSDEPRPVSPKLLFQSQKIWAEVDQEKLRDDAGQCKAVPFPRTAKNDGELDSYPAVPLLIVQPSILNNVPFMPKIFNNVLTYFKHLIRISLNMSSWQLNIPRQVCNEIDRKIIQRISNMENCGEGVQLILNYLSFWLERNPSSTNMDVQKLLHEVKVYADSFVTFTWSKALADYQTNPETEDYFCNILPLRLNLLFQMMLIFNAENPMKFFTTITKGLHWLDELIQKGSKTTREFIEELTCFVLDPNSTAYEKVKNLGKSFWAEVINPSSQTLNYSSAIFPFMTDGNWERYSSLSSSTSSVTSTGSSIVKNDNTINALTDFQS